MPAKPNFSQAQVKILQDTASRVYKRKFKNQEDFALALGVTQQTVSNLLRRKYTPGVEVARHIANLDGQTLEDLVGEFAKATTRPDARTDEPSENLRYPNLEACVRFYSGTKHWASWTLAAARAGFWGDSDLPPPQWPDRLDALERALERLRKGIA